MATKPRDFSDMGKLLGAKLARGSPRTAICPGRCCRPGRASGRPRSGLSEYSVQLSGNTIFVSDPDKAAAAAQSARRAAGLRHSRTSSSPQAVAQAISHYVANIELDDGERSSPMPFTGAARRPMRAFSASPRHLALALADAIAARGPSTSCSTATSPARWAEFCATNCRSTAPLLIVDGVLLSDFDYIDFGRMRLPSNTVPVTIKSLLFSKDPRMERRSRTELATIINTRKRHASWPRTQ